MQNLEGEEERGMESGEMVVDLSIIIHIII